MTNPSRVGVERPRRPLRLVVPRRKGLDGVEPGQAQRRDGRLGASGEHDVRVAPGDHPERIPDGVRPGAAGGDGRGVRAAGLVADGDLAGRLVDDDLDEEERRDAAGPLLEEDLVRLLEGADAADAGADADARPVAGQGLEGDPRVLDRQLGRGHGVLGEEVHLPDFFPVDERQGVEAPDLPREAGLEPGGVEPCHGADAALAAEQGLPGRLRADAERRDQPDAGDGDPAPAVPGSGR